MTLLNRKNYEIARKAGKAKLPGCRKITRNSPKIRTYSSSSLSKIIDLGANRNRMHNFVLVINSKFDRIS